MAVRLVFESCPLRMLRLNLCAVCDRNLALRAAGPMILQTASEGLIRLIRKLRRFFPKGAFSIALHLQWFLWSVTSANLHLLLSNVVVSSQGPLTASGACGVLFE